jgi:hypothetical protein
MPQVTGMLRREAIGTVLARLGDDNIHMIKQNLRADYKIDLEHDDTFALEELQIALHRILGANGASLIIREIYTELRLLSSK